MPKTTVGISIMYFSPYIVSGNLVNKWLLFSLSSGYKILILLADRVFLYVDFQLAAKTTG